jgi:hypothetical protein
MSDSGKLFYIKFKIGPKDDQISGYFLSEDRDRVQKWEAELHAEEEHGRDTDGEPIEGFRSIARDFPKSIEAFRRTVPFIMQLLPQLLRHVDDQTIRGYAKERGNLLEKNGFETYELSMDHMAELVRRIDSSGPIGQGIQNLPSMFLVGLISAYDGFLGQLIRAMFIVQPGLLSSSERNISFRDLVEIGSVEEARERIIEREIEAVLRSNHADQIAWLESRLKTPLTKDLAIWPDFIELCERRNLLTHTGGVISGQYLSVCRAHGCDMGAYKIGQRLNVEARYYRRAVSIILEMGMKLIQVVWRKIVPEDIETADKELNYFAYELIVKRMYALAATMLKFGLFEMKKHGTEAIRRQMVVNYANAEKLGGNKENAIEILDQEDWTASTDLFKICVAAVKDDFDTVISMMKGLIDTKVLTLRELRTWPVFETARSNAEFIDAFEREFGEKLLQEKEGASLVNQDTIDGDLELENETSSAVSVETDPTLH